MLGYIIITNKTFNLAHSLLKQGNSLFDVVGWDKGLENNFVNINLLDALIHFDGVVVCLYGVLLKRIKVFSLNSFWEG